MHILQWSNLFSENHPQLTLLLAVLPLSWLFFSRLRLWQRLQNRLPILIALIDLVLAPLTLVLFFIVIRKIVASTALSVEGWFSATFSFALCLTISWYLARGLYTLITLRYIEERSDHPQSIPGLLRSVIYGACLFAGAGIFFWIQGYSLTGIWISTGLFTALIGFALQQTLGDFFSGLALSLEGAFRLGDWLVLENGVEGKVIDVNWRATWLRCWDNTTQIIPNGKLAGQGFKNLHNKHHYYRPWYYVKIPSEVDPRFAKELLLEAALSCRNILKEPAPIVRMTDGSTLPYTYMLWVSFPNYPAMFRGREELYRAIHTVLQRAGVSPAAEIRENHIRRVEKPSAEAPTIQLALRSLELFHNLKDEEIAQIALAGQQVRYDTDSTILLEGDWRDALDIVVSGIVDSHIELPNGESIKTGEFSAGQYFGLVSMFTDQPSIFNYTAQTDVTLIRIDPDTIQEILKNHPNLADYYAMLIKQRLDEAELLRSPHDQQVAPAATLQQVKYLVKKFIRNTKR